MLNSKVAFVLPWAFLTAFCGTGASKSEQPTATSSSAAAQQPAETPKFERTRKKIDAAPMSLRDLIDNADKIVQGTVEKIEEKSVPMKEGDRTVSVPIREVTLKVERAMKGNVTDGQTLVIRQTLSLSSPLQQGESVVWYLAAESALGLTQPLGLFSGDFRVDTKDPERKAVNLKQNAGLWKGQLWDEGFEASRVQAEATATLNVPASRRGRLREVGSATPSTAGVPLDFLVSTTLSKIKAP